MDINRKSFNCLFEPTTMEADPNSNTSKNSYGVTNQVIVDLEQFRNGLGLITQPVRPGQVSPYKFNQINNEGLRQD
ncbi:hypothetical protein RRG08_006480 [Elysia crispata]|uniref:Uncharacterized protein n=1 Tax=Elysia crispata TaxID=231223 RepID=A0AAE1CV90_9GAST|nr:hypothetical protein RRG08_006480 [Elysia crispata]